VTDTYALFYAFCISLNCQSQQRIVQTGTHSFAFIATIRGWGYVWVPIEPIARALRVLAWLRCMAWCSIEQAVELVAQPTPALDPHPRAEAPRRNTNHLIHTLGHPNTGFYK